MTVNKTTKQKVKPGAFNTSVIWFRLVPPHQKLRVARHVMTQRWKPVPIEAQEKLQRVREEHLERVVQKRHRQQPPVRGHLHEGPQAEIERNT